MKIACLKLVFLSTLFLQNGADARPCGPGEIGFSPMVGLIPPDCSDAPAPAAAVSPPAMGPRTSLGGTNTAAYEAALPQIEGCGADAAKCTEGGGDAMTCALVLKQCLESLD